MKKLKKLLIVLCILAIFLVLGYGYYRYTDYYYGKQIYMNCKISSEKTAYEFSKDDKLVIPITIDNQSRSALQESDSYFVSYHLLDMEGNVVEKDGERTPINIPPFRSAEVPMAFYVLEPGDYQLKIDVLREGRYWHEELGGSTYTVTVSVK